SRWGRTRNLDERELRELEQALTLRLDEPHMRDLTRNAMQLAILLSLINTLGHSMPDARTALYDEYVKLFLNREAEKSEAVRRLRRLIVDVHRYVAWVLHTGVEGGNPQ